MITMSEKILYLRDNIRPQEEENVQIHITGGSSISSKLEFFNDDTGEQIWEPLHNKTVIAGAGLTLQKLFGFDRSVLNNTPTYDQVMNLDDAANYSAYPTISVTNPATGEVIGSIPDESQRTIIGFCLGSAGAGIEATNVFPELYAYWIKPDVMVPFRYPLESADDVDEDIYKGKKTITLSNGQVRCAYYFKTFANTPNLVQNYVSTIGVFDDLVTPSKVYESTASADKAQSFVELHLKVTKADCREFFIAHNGLDQSKINQISLVSGWKKNVTRQKLNSSGVVTSGEYEVFQQVRPFSICNFPTEILSDREKAISIIYTLYA